MTIKERIELFYQDVNANSDKFYVAELQVNKGQCSVFVRWGRNGTVGQTGYKCQDVSYADAKKAFDKVVGEKTGKGYHLGEGPNQSVIPLSQELDLNPATVQPAVASEPKAGGGLHHRKVVWKDDESAQPPVIASAVNSMLPQLLNEIEESEVEKYINDPDFCAQEKHDGRRRGLHFESGKVSGYNKKGKEVVFPATFRDACKEIAELNGLTKITLDGEEVGETFFAFDTLLLGGENLRGSTYEARIHKLSMMNIQSESITVVETAYTTKEKRDLYHKLKDLGKEGIVFKRLSGTHKVGYAHEDQKKFKFYSTASVVVIKHNVKNSLAMAVWDPQAKKLVPVGNVTMIGHTRPPVGSVIEVSFLYANKGGCLYQPSYIGPRDDMDKEDCSISKLKFKAVPTEEDL